MTLDTNNILTNSDAAVSPGSHFLEYLAPNTGWQSMRQAEHFVQFYESDEFIVRSVSDYVAHGMDAGDICIVVATQDHIEKIEARLVTDGHDVTQARKAGEFISMDARETLAKFMKNDLPDPKMFDQVIGSLVKNAAALGPVRIFGEMVGILMAEKQVDACAKLENLWEDLCDKYPVSLFCAYPLDHFSHGTGSECLVTMCGSHSKVIPAESYTSLTTIDERMRAITFLQQRGKQLEAEITELRKSIASKAPR